MATAVNTMLMPAQPAQIIEDTVPAYAESYGEAKQYIEVKTSVPKKEEDIPQTVEDMIRKLARSNNLNEDKVVFIAKCESRLEPEMLGDGHLTCKRIGKPMRSRGIWQINECYHPEVSDKQAFDPEWATKWAIEKFKKGTDSKEWLLCSRKYAKQATSEIAETKSENVSKRNVAKKGA